MHGGEFVESAVDVVEHADDGGRLDSGRDVGERRDVTEQYRHLRELLCNRTQAYARYSIELERGHGQKTSTAMIVYVILSQRARDI